MGEWQPIETAPKDGTPVLLAQGGIVALGFCDGADWHFWEGDYDGAVFGDEDGHFVRLNEWVTPYGPTHWKPKDPPPGTPSPREAAIQQLVEALEVAQKTLAILINPEANEKATGAGIINAFAQCTEAEAKARAALSAFRKETQ